MANRIFNKTRELETYANFLGYTTKNNENREQFQAYAFMSQTVAIILTP